MASALTHNRSLFPFGPFWDDVFKTGTLLPRGEDRQLRPALDVSESEEAITISVELPGIPKDSVHVSIEDGVLTISGEKKAATERHEDTYHIVERSYGSFTRSLTLPTTVNPDEADAGFDNGLLSIRLPKHEQVKPKRLEIK